MEARYQPREEAQLIEYAIENSKNPFGQRLKRMLDYNNALRNCPGIALGSDRILDSYNMIIERLEKNPDISKLDTILKYSEAESITCFLSPLNVVDETIDYYIKKSRSNGKNFINEILVEVLSMHFQSIFESKVNFKDFWDIFHPYMTIFNIEDNLLISHLAVRSLCEDDMIVTIDQKRILPNLEKLPYFFSALLSKPKNVLYHMNISNLYTTLPIINRSRVTLSYPISIVCTRVFTKFLGNSEVLTRGQTWSISPDHGAIIVFGRHKLATVRFPPMHKEIDSTCLVIFIGESSYSIIDCAKNCNACIKLQPGVRYRLSKGMVISIAQVINICITEIVDGLDNSVLSFEYIDGKYKGTKVNLNTRINGQDERKTVFSLGRGGNGNIDLYCDHEAIQSADDSPNQRSRQSLISSRHLEFRCEDDGWKIEDTASSNGTFRYIKNGDQFASQNESNSLSIFNDDIRGPVCLQISRYTFLIRK